MPYQQVTLATMQQELLDRVESVPFWTSAESTSALNEALRIWNLFTGTWKRRVVLPTTPSTPWYVVPGTLVYNVRMDFSSYPLEQSTLLDLDNFQPQWEGQTTATSGVPSQPAMWAPAGLTLFAVWPNDAVGGNEIAIDGVASTPTLSAAGDFVDLGQDEHNALLGYAQHYLAFKEGGMRFQATLPLYQQFLIAAADKNLRLRASTFFRKLMGLDTDRYGRPMRVPAGQATPAPQGA